MATYSFTTLHDNSIHCIMTRRPDLLQYAHDRGAFDAAGYAAALDHWWTHGAVTAPSQPPIYGGESPKGPIGGPLIMTPTTTPSNAYVSIDDFMAAINCPIVARDAAAPAVAQPSELEGLLGNKWLLGGAAAVVLFLMFGRRRGAR